MVCACEVHNVHMGVAPRILHFSALLSRWVYIHSIVNGKPHIQSHKLHNQSQASNCNEFDSSYVLLVAVHGQQVYVELLTSAVNFILPLTSPPAVMGIISGGEGN